MKPHKQVLFDGANTYALLSTDKGSRGLYSCLTVSEKKANGILLTPLFGDGLLGFHHLLKSGERGTQRNVDALHAQALPIAQAWIEAHRQALETGEREQVK